MPCIDYVIQCKENPLVHFSQMITLFKLKNHYTVQRPPVPSPLLLEVLKCSVTKKTTKSFGNLDYTKTIFLLLQENYLHSKMWNMS